MNTKYIFISGGVISGIGKGITTSAVSVILKARGYKVLPIKADMYFNVDAGTLRPTEHGEVFVTDDGMETDQDIGNYERFLNAHLSKSSYVTNGQIYFDVIKKERSFLYEGATVEPIPHITNEIAQRIVNAGKQAGAEIVIVEIGGTVGEYQNALFFEASRLMKLKGHNDVIQIHVGYLPIPGNLGEMKSKPIQQSVRMLNSMGIQPDFIIGRASAKVDEKRKQKLAMYTNVPVEHIISNPDMKYIYEVPLVLEEQQMSQKILDVLQIPPRQEDLQEWRNLIDKIYHPKEEVTIGVVGKYFGTGDYELEDVYISVIESLKHACWWNTLKPKLVWIDSVKIEKEGIDRLKDVDGIVVPGGFGSSGVEGILQAIQYARENGIPYLGLCYGMQLASVEFARNVLGYPKANTTEIDTETPHPIIHIMPEQEKKLLSQEYGGSMRLGAWEAKLVKETQVYGIYKKQYIHERHRHRYEFNNEYRKEFEKNGFVISGTSIDGHLVEFIELPSHPFFIGTQAHPEFQSTPLHPHPLFVSFIAACRMPKKR